MAFVQLMMIDLSVLLLGLSSLLRGQRTEMWREGGREKGLTGHARDTGKTGKTEQDWVGWLESMAGVGLLAFWAQKIMYPTEGCHNNWRGSAADTNTVCNQFHYRKKNPICKVFHSRMLQERC